MSKARELADLRSSLVILSDVGEVTNSLKVDNFIYGPEDVPALLSEGTVYIQIVPEA